MSTDPQRLRIVVAFAKDVSEARTDLSEVAQRLNQTAAVENRQGSVEITAWWEEDENPGFYRESPHILIEEIRRAHNPDIIIGVFWKRFGTAMLDSTLDIEKELESATRTWKQPDHPQVRLYFCDKTPSLANVEERTLRSYIIAFRGIVQPETFWWSYKKRSEFRTAPHELREIVYQHLLKFIRRWKTNIIAPPPELDLLEDEWRYIAPSELSRLRSNLEAGNRLNTDDAVSYFNGEEPKWKFIVSESIPRREVVSTIIKGITDAAEKEHTRVTLLTGPGGEGKSTILQQVAVDLTENHQGIHVIWRQKPNALLNESLIRQLLGKPESFVIICDNAAQIAKHVYEMVPLIQDARRSNIQFLLASQSTEWQWMQAPLDYQWRRQLGENKFANIAVKKLDLEDARRIVEKWGEVGAAGLGNLAAIPENDRARHLTKLAYEEECNNPDEGPLLGAMLLARKDDVTFQGYVEDILHRLKRHSAPGGKSLQDVFAYIAALHADAYLKNESKQARGRKRQTVAKPPRLSKPILRRVLSCSLEELEEHVLTPLVDEAATSRSGYFVLLRHRRIAEVAKRILSEKFPNRFEEQIYPDLLREARKAYLNKREIDENEVKAWNNLPRFYFEYGKVELALRLAKVLADVEEYDPVPVVSWAHIYRDANRKKEAAELFGQRFELVKPDKGYFYEWSVAEGQINNHCYSTWLTGIALSDETEERQGRDAPVMMRLSGLTTSLGKLFEKASNKHSPFYDPSHAQIFLQACAAAAQLGLDNRAQKNIRSGFDYNKAEENLTKGKNLGLAHNLSPLAEASAALDVLFKGVNLAWDLREKDQGELPNTLPSISELKFKKFVSLFSEEGKSDKRDAAKIPKLRSW